MNTEGQYLRTEPDKGFDQLEKETWVAHHIPRHKGRGSQQKRAMVSKK